MAKISMSAREKHKIKLSDLPVRQSKRRDLKKIISSLATSYDEKVSAVTRLNKRKRNESKSRVTRRCRQCGRPHAVYRRFALCRICLRIAAMKGFVPGLVKSSW